VFLPLREEHTLQILRNKIIKIFGSGGEEELQ
jgi:hypothetical protein